ncbi:MAG: hypothetical protein JNJ83_04925 [Verrucomicrobiaceae bacterium]|nr:hypothetical protein [Verrucomicrobiaceae bacterium]
MAGRDSRKRSNWTNWLILLAAFGLVGCDKIKPSGDSGQATAQVIPTVASEGLKPAGPQKMSSQADKLGFIAKLPPTTQLYFGTLNMKRHLEQLSQTTFFNEVTAYLDDKTPAPTKDGKGESGPAVPAFWSDDAFIAAGPGTVELLAVLSELARENNLELYQKLASLWLPTDEAAPKTTDQLETLLLKVQDLSVPEITIGFRAPDAETGLDGILTSGMRKLAEALGPKLEVTLPDGGRFSLHEGKLAAALQAWKLPESKKLAPVIEKLSAKSLSLAYGYTAGHALVVIGSTRPQFQYATDPEQSLVGNTEWDLLTPQAAKPLTFIGWADAMILEATHQGEWLTPLLDSVLASATKDSPLSGLHKGLEPQLKALLASERRFLQHSYAHAAMLGWWKQGLHVEVHGGIVEDAVGQHSELPLAAALDEPDVLFGYAGNLPANDQQRFSEYLETWAALLRQSALSYIDKQASSQPANIKPWLEEQVFPPIQQFYESAMKLARTGFGPQRAWVIKADTESGKESLPVPSLARLATVTDRRALSRAWLEMEPAIQALQTALPMLLGAEPPKITKEVMSGLDVYLLPVPTPWPEIQPCVAVGDEVFMLSTASTLAESLAGRMRSRQPAIESGCSMWRLNVPLLKQLVTAGSEASDAAAFFKSITRWLTPLGQLRHHASLKDGRVKRLWSWEMKDPERFD